MYNKCRIKVWNLNGPFPELYFTVRNQIYACESETEDSDFRCQKIPEISREWSTQKWFAGADNHLTAYWGWYP